MIRYMNYMLLVILESTGLPIIKCSGFLGLYSVENLRSLSLACYNNFDNGVSVRREKSVLTANGYLKDPQRRGMDTITILMVR